MVILCVVYLGDEVIVVELIYDSYLLLIEFVGGKLVFVMLEVFDYVILFDCFVVVIMLKMWMILINMLYNLMGIVWCEVDMCKFEDIVCGINVLILFDEVYEYMVYDGVCYESVVCYLEFVVCSFIVLSFGKIYYVMGWKVGYVVVFVVLIVEFCKVY